MLTVEQIKERDLILFDSRPDWSDPAHKDGIVRFKGLTLAGLRFMIENKYIDLDEYQNSSPTTQDFLDFMEKYPVALAHGYVIDPAREDACMVLEGLAVARGDVTLELFRAFVALCRCADEFTDNDGGLYSWWD